MTTINALALEITNALPEGVHARASINDEEQLVIELLYTDAAPQISDSSPWWRVVESHIPNGWTDTGRADVLGGPMIVGGQRYEGGEYATWRRA